MEKMSEMITNFGFPIVLSFYLLVRTETKMDKLTDAIQELNQIIQKCTK